MIEIEKWMEQYLQALRSVFEERIWFVGLQGSYGRGEATERSDLDVVLILDELSSQDLFDYEALLNQLPHREMVCGFVSAKKELLNWEPSDLFQFYYDTKPLVGSLDELLDVLDDEAVSRAIKIGVCNIYHGCVHNMLHDKSEEILRGLYKSAAFVIQAIWFRENGKYISRQTELLESVSSEDKEILSVSMALKNGSKADFREVSEKLFNWSKKRICA